jgi:hypothetical protein
MAFPVGTLRHEKLKDVHTPHWLAELEAAICSETEADSKIATHKGDTSAHHAKTTSASEITSGRFGMARMPDMALGKVMVGQGAVNNPIEGTITEALHDFKGLYWYCNHWLPSGFLTNGVSGSGNISWDTRLIGLYTGTTVNSDAFIYKLFTRYRAGLDGGSWEKKRHFKVNVRIDEITAQIIHLVSGAIADNKAEANTWNHIGFKVINAVLYGTVANGTTESILTIATLTGSERRELEAVLTPGVECRFYMDGVDKGALTANLPTGTSFGIYALRYSVCNTEAIDKRGYISTASILQEE